MAEENEKDVAEGGDAPKKKGGNLGVLIGLIVGILVIQIGVAIFVVKITAPKDDATEELEDGKKNEEKIVSLKNEIVAPETFDIVVNIAETDGSRFLKINIAVAYDGDNKENKNLTANYVSLVTKIKSKLVEYLSSLTIEDVTARNAQKNIRGDILRECNKVIPDGQGSLSNVYINEFIIQ